MSDDPPYGCGKNDGETPRWTFDTHMADNTNLEFRAQAQFAEINFGCYNYLFIYNHCNVCYNYCNW